MYNLEYICELFNFFVHKWSYKMYISFRFHYSKCLFSKLKGKLHIGGSYMPNWSTMQKILLGIIWQYFALPKLHEVHMRAEVEKLGKQLHAYATSGLVSEDTACRLIKFHNYVVDFWKAKQRSSTISVVRWELIWFYSRKHSFSCTYHKSSPCVHFTLTKCRISVISESCTTLFMLFLRYHKTLNSELPGQHPSIFHFMDTIRKTFVRNSFCGPDSGGKNFHAQARPSQRWSRQESKGCGSWIHHRQHHCQGCPDSSCRHVPYSTIHIVYQQIIYTNVLTLEWMFKTVL